VNGLFQFRDIDVDFANGAFPAPITTSISYEVTDVTGAMDTAEIFVEVLPFFDGD